MRTLVTGATGFIGSRLLARLERPVAAARDPERARRVLSGNPGLEIRAWNPSAAVPDPSLFRGIDAVIHLAGEPVADRRWNPAVKTRIRDSRVLGTRRLVDALAASPTRPEVLVSASAVGYYGNRDDEILAESSAPGTGFLAKTCQEWEAEAFRAREAGVRVMTVRIGVVLGLGGGALAKMLLPFRLGLGGRLGSGRQWMSWIHADDLVGILLHAAARDDLAGPVNCVSPNPATNRDFTKALGSALGRPALFPVPARALKLAVGEFAEILLGSQRVHPEAARRSGYAFRHPDLAGALKDIFQ